jgi:hypothetical protein
VKSQTCAQSRSLNLKKFNFEGWNHKKNINKKNIKEKKTTKTMVIKFDKKKPRRMKFVKKTIKKIIYNKINNN